MFGAAKLTRNSTNRKFIYNNYGIAFDGAVSWSFGNEFAKNAFLVLALVH